MSRIDDASAARIASHVVVTDAVPADTIILVSPTCACSHSITNHLTGRCDVCPCLRGAATMATMLKISDEP